MTSLNIHLMTQMSWGLILDLFHFSPISRHSQILRIPLLILPLSPLISRFCTRPLSFQGSVFLFLLPFPTHPPIFFLSGLFTDSLEHVTPLLTIPHCAISGALSKPLCDLRACPTHLPSPSPSHGHLVTYQIILSSRFSPGSPLVPYLPPPGLSGESHPLHPGPR